MTRKQINLQEAINLRLKGKSYKEISGILGCSQIWCKINLKGIKHQDISEDDLLELKTKGKSKDCLTKPEIFSKLNFASFEGKTEEEVTKMKKAALRRTKDKLTKDEPDVLIRQPWIHPERARQSYNSMLMYINMLNDVLDEYVRSHLVECGFDDYEHYDSALHFMVLNSQFGSLQNAYQAGVFEAVQNTVDKIQERNGHTPVAWEPKDTSWLNIEVDKLPY